MASLSDLIDAALETTVVLSFTNVGCRARRRLFDWPDLATMRMEGRVVVVTGGNSGLGHAAASQLVAQGAAVRLVVRDRQRGEAARGRLLDAKPGADVTVHVADMSEMDSVRAVASDLRAHDPAIDVLVNNAGGLLAERRTTSSGLEITFATMVLGPFLLTRELIPSMEAAAASRGRSRVVNVASGGMYTQGLHLDDLQMERNYRGSVAYARAKRAQVVLTETWARRLRDRNITVNAMHPGWADTPGLEAGLPTFRKLTGRFLRSGEEGADTIVWLAVSDEAARWTGKFWLDRRPRSTERQRGTYTTPEQAQQLWDVCERLSREGEAATPQ